MRPRPATVVFALAASLAVAGLLAAAATDNRRTAFSLGVPNNLVVATLPRAHRLCQGPFTVPRRFSAVELWVKPRSRFELQLVSAAEGTPLASVETRGSGAPTGSSTVPVRGANIAAGTAISVCVRNLSPSPLRIEGGPANGASGHARINGRRTGNAIALLFLRSHGPTLLSMLPTVFHRAALFKLDGVGAWTFWLLLGGMLAAFPLAAFALASAVKADAAADDERGG